jgi:hypothetical protein
MYEHSLGLDPHLFQTHLQVGDLHFAQKQWEDAVNAYQEVLKLKPGLTVVQLRLAVARDRLQR